MRPAHCLFSPSRALRSVFLPAQLEMATNITRLPVYLLAPRLFSTSSPRSFIRSRPKPPSSGGGGGGQKQGGKLPSNLPSDNAIPYTWIRVAECQKHGMKPMNPNTDLSIPLRARDVLRNLDRAKYTLVMVALPPSKQRRQDDEEAQDEEDVEDQPRTPQELEERERRDSPVCRIIDKQAHVRDQEDKAKEARRKELNRKEIELNWAIAPNDLQHRLKQMRAFLEKGKRVEIMIAKKRGGRVATADEAAALLEALKEAAAETKATQVKITGQFPAVVRLIYEGKAPKSA
ncbi:hypothetical protein PFICI_07836 [Pestalotiopsis fici W106-1]|uniref:Translation initiation factor 3 C-terminal domain-containing protein n=1 Tax=Pestalotiopsis fici (strain W106-1 / CGMCC3.15140) TaxID=1229662 RepID=W3X4K2_PESFW|nr:uncharacterized protein PFICI_07836 [Pestalotiopsis fici W106-1]ETS80307.1 hypothetical protein PFICI_07836 [Pestalotiopsis fici W106-1]